MAQNIDRPEERWRLSKNPYTLVQLVRERRQSPRKFRLVAAACCRVTWDKLDDEQRRALAIVERHADGDAKYNEMRVAVQGMRIPGYRSQPLLVEAARRDAWAGLSEVLGDLLGVLWRGKPNDLEEARRQPHGDYWPEADEWQTACAAFCHIVRDCFADVFRPVRIAPHWRTAAVTDLAAGAYKHRELPAGHFEPGRMAVLADALEEAGCDDPLVFEHLRGAGPHVRGCWLVDLLLGKE